MRAMDYWIEKLKLQPHPEGGYYSEIYRSGETIKEGALPSRFKSGRSFSTSIYFLLKGDQTNLLHKINSDEIWHFYYGSPLVIHIFEKNNYYIKKLGQNLEDDQSLQVVVPHGSFFAAEVIDGDSYSLVGCTVSPGFDFEDFEMGDRKQLIQKFPGHEDVVVRFTKE